MDKVIICDYYLQFKAARLRMSPDLNVSDSLFICLLFFFTIHLLTFLLHA